MYKNCRNLRRAFLATTHAQESVQQKQTKSKSRKERKWNVNHQMACILILNMAQSQKPKQIDNHKVTQIKME